jgi:hypothetical protein
MPNADSELDQYLVDPKTVLACVAFIDRWGENRKHIRAGFTSLKAHGDLSVSSTPLNCEW